MYAARALLALRGEDAVLVVEHDEDIEIVRPESHTYIQVKFRAGGLSRRELAEISGRFDRLRAIHATGERPVSACFVIATNSPPQGGYDELARLPADVHLTYPSAPAVDGLPVSSPDVDTAFAALEEAAATVPLAGLTPESLARKLIGFANALASGARAHRIASEEIGSLCDVIVEQLQSFPASPSPYRPQRGEPDLLGGARVRLLSGISGAGKTAWASTKARGIEAPTVYFDVAGIPEANLPLSLARNLAARFIDDPVERRAIIVGDTAGIDVLRAVVRRITLPQAQPTLVLDNVHLIDATVVVTIARVLDPVRLVILSQPSVSQTLLEALLPVRVEALQGWDDDAIALEIVEQGAHADATTIGRLRRLTGALPLLVTTAARLAEASYGGNVADMCLAMERGVTTEQTAQHIVLESFIRTLSPGAQDSMALLGLAETSLLREEAIAFVQSRTGDSATAAGHMRTLSSAHVVQSVSNGKLALHDAFRPLALSALAQLGAEAMASARVALRDILARSLVKSGDVERLRLWMRLASETGDLDPLIDVALDEMIHQIGGPEIVRSTLENAANSGNLEPSKQFDALDALAFWDAQRDDGLRLAGYVKRMSVIAEAVQLEPHQLVNLAAKQILVAVDASDRVTLEEAYDQGLAIACGHVGYRRMLSYNRARGLLRLGAVKDAALGAESLVTEYLDGFGLSLDGIILKQPPELASRIPEYPSRMADLRHLADALHVLALTRRPPERTLLLIQAVKFYAVAWVPSSVVRLGQDIVDDFIAVGDALGARISMELHVLPVIEDARLADLMIDARAQYAVVLARTGDAEQARSLMRTLEKYDVDPEMRAQLRAQSDLIETISRNALSDDGGQQRRLKEKIGRNSLCPCGSGAKFKKFHGRL